MNAFNWQLGTIGEFAAAIVSGVAVVWAILSNRAERTRSALNIEAEQALTREALALERERWQYEREDRERRQAVSVALNAERGDDRRLTITIGNESDASIFDVSPFYFDDEHNWNPQPVCSWKLCRNDTVYETVTIEGVEAYDKLRFKDWGITFRDAAGVHWGKYGDGALMKIYDDQPLFTRAE